jgi:HlyD family secretion protein
MWHNAPQAWLFMKGKINLAWVFIAAAVAAGGWFGWSRYKASSSSKAPNYRTNILSRGDIIQAVTANGALNPVRIVTVGSQISGIISELKADFNDLVKQDQILANIDPSTYERDLATAEADLSNGKAALELAQFNAERSSQLYKEKLISQADYQASVVALHQAEAVVKMKEASRERAKVELSYTTIKAPIAGVVISRAVEAGQTVAASFNTPEIFQIAADLTKMQILALVSEADVGGIKLGESVTFQVDAYPGRQFEGAVTQIRYAPVTNQNVVSYTTVVSVTNSDMKLFPGMTANASIITASRSNIVRLPNAALRFHPPAAAVVAETNGVSMKPGEHGQPAGAGGELPPPPWAGQGRPPTAEERKAYEASLSPDQLKQYQANRERMRAARDGGSAGLRGGMGGAGGGRPSDGPQVRTVYIIDKGRSTPQQTVLDAVRVKLGIADSSFTEVLEGLNENDVVVTGSDAVDPAAIGGPRPGGPFGGGPFGGGPGMRR